MHLEKYKQVPKVVYILGLVSFFNDTASEMLYPILPIFITQVLGAPVFVVGIIEGVAEGSASLLKTFFGYYSDKTQKRKPFVVSGYGASAFSKVIIALSSTWPLVFVGRVVDRFGKGLRTGARDALLLEASDDTNKGLIFGLHRTMDTAGAVVGPSIALILLHFTNNNIRLILFIAIIPAVLGLLLFIYVKEAKKQLVTTKTTLSLSLKNLPPQVKLFVFGMALFSLGNSSDTFLILRAKNLGLSLVMVIGAYVLYNVVYAAFSTPAGEIADRIGPKRVFLLGIVIFAAVYMGFALNTSQLMVWLLFAIYGGYIAFTDGVSKAMIGAMVREDAAGTTYGVVQTVMSIFTLLASLIAGFLWSAISPGSAFLFGAICAAISFFIFVRIIDP